MITRTIHANSLDDGVTPLVALMLLDDGVSPLVALMALDVSSQKMSQ